MAANTGKEAAPEVREFIIDIPDALLEDMYERLRRTRFSRVFANDYWRYGYNTAYHRELVDYWIHEYDWRAIERSTNELAPHYKMTLMDVPLHFIHVKGKGPSPMAAAHPPRLALDLLGPSQGDRTTQDPDPRRRPRERRRREERSVMESLGERFDT